MEIGTVIVVAILVAAGLWLAFGRNKPSDSVPTPAPEPQPQYTEEELMKKTKKELIALASELGLNLKSSDTKPNLIAQIIARKEGAHLL